jgi:hypothetical protein
MSGGQRAAGDPRAVGQRAAPHGEPAATPLVAFSPLGALALVAILALAATAALLRAGGSPSPRPPAAASPGAPPVAPPGAFAAASPGAPGAPGPPPIKPLRVASGGAIATGFAIGDGRVLTVAHVLDGPVTVGRRRVRVLRVDRRNDLALLAVPGAGAPGAGARGAAGASRPAAGASRPAAGATRPAGGASRPAAGATRPAAGATVPAVRATAFALASAHDGEHLWVLRFRGGAPSSLSVYVRRSIVAHVRAPGSGRVVVRPALELAGRVAPGDSGAAVITDAGALAGVVFASSRNSDDTAYAVDASAVRALANRP